MPDVIIARNTGVTKSGIPRHRAIDKRTAMSMVRHARKYPNGYNKSQENKRRKRRA